MKNKIAFLKNKMVIMGKILIYKHGKNKGDSEDIKYFKKHSKKI